MRITETLDRWLAARSRRDAAPRRATFVSVDEVPCTTAAVQLFEPGARPAVVAYRRRHAWLEHPRETCTHEVLRSLEAAGAREVRLRWRTRTLRLALQPGS